MHEGLAALWALRLSRLRPISFSMAMNDYGFLLVSPTEPQLIDRSALVIRRNEMGKAPESPMDRLKKITFLQWGLIVIFAGIMTGVVGQLQGTSGSAAEAQAQTLGKAVASGFFVLCGVVLIDHICASDNAQAPIPIPCKAQSANSVQLF